MAVSSIWILVAEVVAGNEVDAGGLLQLPVLGAQFGGGGLDGGEVVGTLPVAFDDFLQFAVLPDAGKPDGSQSDMNPPMYAFVTRLEGRKIRIFLALINGRRVSL